MFKKEKKLDSTLNYIYIMLKLPFKLVKKIKLN